jgi:hypothetical protein
MSKINIKGGTPMGSTSKCESCTWAHIIRGYRESEMLVYCECVSPNVLVPFKVYECSAHMDINRPSWKQMVDLAIDVLPYTSTKPVGFCLVKEDESAEEQEAVAVRE